MPAMTNEERFIASCLSVGEADVRQKLNANRYGGRRAVWASSWLEQLESGKSDATVAEEKSSRLPKPGASRHVSPAISALLFGLLLASVVLFLKFR
jgi:hypothetical protein